MKKILFFGGLLLSAMTFVSCNDDFADWTAPQSNPQEEAVTLPGLTATAAAAIDLNNVGSSVQAFTLSVPAETTVENVRIELTPEGGTGSTTLDATVDGSLDSAAVQAVVEEYYGKRVEPRAFTGRVLADIMVDGQAFLANAGTVNLTVTPKAPLYAAQYYIIGGMNGWDNAGTTLAFYKESDAVFSYTANWTAGNDELKFTTDTGLGTWDEAYGDGGNGTILSNETKPGNFKAPSNEYYTFTIDMENMTYTWTRLDNQNPTSYNSIGIVGDFTTWADGADVLMTEVTPHNWYASGVNITAGGVKFRVDGGWDVNWGCDTNIADQNYGTGVSGGGNLTVPDGTYSVYFNDITAQFVFVAE